MSEETGFRLVVYLPDGRTATSPPIRLMSEEAGRYSGRADLDMAVENAPGVRLHITATLGLTVPVPDVNQPGVIPKKET